MYYVYWIRSKKHTDVLTQGYVGITSNLPDRLRSHKKNKRKTPLTCAVSKHGWDNLVVDILHEGLSLQDALSIELNLRPSIHIGWNCQKGGELGVDSSWYKDAKNRSKHRDATSVATKAGIAEKDTTEARSLRAKANWKIHRNSYNGISKGSNNPRAVLTENDVRSIKGMLSTHSTRELADKFRVRIHVIQQIKSGKNWSHI